MSPSLLRAMMAGFLLIFSFPSHAVDSTTAAASLLAASDDDGWSLESMRTTGQPHWLPDSIRDNSRVAESDVRQLVTEQSVLHAKNGEIKTLRRQVRFLKDILDKAQRELAEIKLTSRPADDSELKRARAALLDREQRIDILNHQTEDLKAALADRDGKLSALLASDDEFRHKRACLRSELVRNEARIISPKSAPGEKERVKELTLALQDRDTALTAALKRADENNTTLIFLRKNLQEKTKAIEDLRAALDARGAELKQAAATMADLRAKQARTAPETPEQKQAYVAGLMMADGLNRRLEAWAYAGVKTDAVLFRRGLEDGLAHKLRLKSSEARHVKAAFMKAVQAGVARKVADAQKQLTALAKGRHALKSNNNIAWYRVRPGKPVTHGRPVRLSMTEQVVGGKTVSKVTALTLREGDNVPAIVRDGMYLPGEGGEVVAYALATDVYGKLPLPAGVQPYTLMEYHLKGESQPRR